MHTDRSRLIGVIYPKYCPQTMECVGSSNIVDGSTPTWFSATLSEQSGYGSWQFVFGGFSDTAEWIDFTNLESGIKTLTSGDTPYGAPLVFPLDTLMRFKKDDLYDGIRHCVDYYLCCEHAMEARMLYKYLQDRSTIADVLDALYDRKSPFYKVFGLSNNPKH
jgi:hypothetical protein